MSRCIPRNCPDCKDRLIHQLRRGRDESSSAFGQYIHDHVDDRMYWADIDGVIFKRDTRMLRVIEHKPRDGNLSAGQRAILPVLAAGIQDLVTRQIVHPQSGVYVVKSDPPFTHGTVQRHRHWLGHDNDPQVDMAGVRWSRFLAGEIDVGEVAEDVDTDDVA